MKVVSVDWEDSTSYNKWRDEDEHKETPLIRIKTVGILLKSGKRKVVVALSIADNEDAADVVNIPRGCVRSMEIIGKVDRPKRGR